MSDKKNKRKPDECFECRGPLELIEHDIEKGIRIRRCQNCGFIHYEKKEFLTGWRLLKVSRLDSSDYGSRTESSRTT